MGKPFTRLGKFLSFVLRHQPERLGLMLDAHGWADVDELLEAANRQGKRISHELLTTIVENDEKQRFAFSPDGKRIRANQGHSIQIDLELEPVKPPEFLYHGTPLRSVDSIREHGLLRMNRTQVHLSENKETAAQVGKRRGESVVIVVEAARMYAAGFKFFQSANGVWLTENVPGEYLVFPVEC